MTEACLPRSRDRIREVVELIDPKKNPELQRRDVTGDGKPETFCNYFVAMFLAMLECAIPSGYLANRLFVWFGKADEGGALGWRKITAAEAALRVELGCPTIGVWTNTAGHGHIVALVPAPAGAPPGRLYSAQAGLRNWNCEPIEHAGLLADAYSFYTHD